MIALSPREKRLIRYSATGLAIYLALFFIWKPLQQRRTEYRALVASAESLKARVQPYSARAENLEKLMHSFQLEPGTLDRSRIVGEASAALQKAATGLGIKVGPVRESANRAAGKELASLQFEGTGQVTALMTLLKRIEALGFPIVIDTIQLTPERAGPGMLKLSLSLVILDFDNWKPEEKPHA